MTTDSAPPSQPAGLNAEELADKWMSQLEAVWHTKAFGYNDAVKCLAALLQSFQRASVRAARIESFNHVLDKLDWIRQDLKPEAYDNKTLKLTEEEVKEALHEASEPSASKGGE